MGNQPFEEKKLRILKHLSTPTAEYTDLSPKGSVDEPIRELIADINRHAGLVTTSSCSGRISVYVEGTGRSDRSIANAGAESAANGLFQNVSGKGGGRWAFVSHEPISRSSSIDHRVNIDLHELFGLKSGASEQSFNHDVRRALVHLKFEPMILHIMTKSLAEAQGVLSAALNAGFRESGAVSLTSSPVVAVRSNGLAFESIIGYEDETGQLVSMVDELYLRVLVSLTDDRFVPNAQRIERFRDALISSLSDSGNNTNGTSKVEEGRAARQDRISRREENKRQGLLRQAHTKANSKRGATSDEPVPLDALFNPHAS